MLLQVFTVRNTTLDINCVEILESSLLVVND